VAKPRLIQQAYRFELAPTAEQALFLGACAGATRFWFNQALAEVKRRLDARQGGENLSVPWSYKALCSELDRGWRAERCDWQHDVVCGSYQGGFESLGLALKNYSEGRRSGRRVGFPRFRRKGGPHTESVVFQRARPLDARHIHLDKRVGPVRSKERMTKLLRLLHRYLVREFGVIGVETLAVNNMLANRRLARQISDAGWGLVLAQLKYKTSWSGGSVLVAADRFYPSSKTCSGCGTVKAKLSCPSASSAAMPAA
jgi:transposase